MVNTSPGYGKTSVVTSTGLLRPFSWPANKAKPDDAESLLPLSQKLLSEPLKPTGFHSLADDDKNEGKY